MGRFVYDHPWVFLPLLFLAASLVIGGLLGLIIRAADTPPLMSARAEALRALADAREHG